MRKLAFAAATPPPLHSPRHPPSTERSAGASGSTPAACSPSPEATSALRAMWVRLLGARVTPALAPGTARPSEAALGPASERLPEWERASAPAASVPAQPVRSAAASVCAEHDVRFYRRREEAWSLLPHSTGRTAMIDRNAAGRLALVLTVAALVLSGPLFSPLF